MNLEGHGGKGVCYGNVTAKTGDSCDKIHEGQNACRKEFETRDAQGNVGEELRNFKTAFVTRKKDVAGKSLD
jgi:hypothetical protein